MHENVLQPVGNRQQTGPSSYGFSSLEDIYSRKTSAVVQPMPIHRVTNTPDKENQPLKPIGISPVLPGTGSVTHNITRMLGDSGQQPRSQLPSTATRASHYSPYSTSHFMSFRQKILNDSKSSHEDDSTVDVENDSHEQLRTSDLPNTTDMSISTQGSTSPQSVGSRSSPSGSTNSSPGSNADPVTSPENNEEQPKKKARTNYTNEQVQKLLKIFHENPYPDSEMMETIGKDLGVPENKIKIWFQNKRARWRRRVNDVNNYPQPFLPVSPMLSPVAPYGFMPTGHMMTSSPPQAIPGYFNYPWMQGSLSPNNNQQLPGQFPANQAQSRLQATNQGASLQNQHFPAVSMVPTTVSSASAYGLKTSPQQMSQTNRHSFQYPSFLYQSSLGTSAYGQS
ncbi:homeobox protein orthopedia-like [Mercenaria mercenaria]|uniref:homeobox protein orthopedia-like n=1 Tax=Mercenaria mercenaria TaxID=6596 RepID=UPI00234F9E3F|nr:homeobox protein orthopedia-like [Mercenaria mercenaria]